MNLVDKSRQIPNPDGEDDLIQPDDERRRRRRQRSISGQTKDTDTDIDDAESDADVVMMDDFHDEMEQSINDHDQNYREASEDDEEDDDDDSDDGEDDEGVNAEERTFMFRSAADRGKMREGVERNTPCFSHTDKYRGHCNVKTVKDANFFGLNDEYVVSGSDSGHVFIWDKKTTEVVNILEGDNEVVNVIQGIDPTSRFR